MPESPMKSLAWPLRRLLDPRFADLVRRLTDTRQAVHDEAALTRTAVTENVDTIVGGYAASSAESLTHVGTELRGVDEALRALADRVEELGWLAGHARAEELLWKLTEGAGPEAIDEAVAGLLNYAESHRGFAAQRGLWFNPPVSLRYSKGKVEPSHMTERVVEVPFAYRALGRVPVGARVLDFGAVESLVSLQLATLGYRVTALDLREYPFQHPNLTSVATRLEDWEAPAGSFDAVLCISTVEHVGIGWYGEQEGPANADRAAIERLGELLTDDGVLVVTVPYGKAEVTDVQRVYDRAALEALLDGWEVLEREVVEKASEMTWSRVDESTGHAVAMVVARPRRGA